MSLQFGDMIKEPASNKPTAGGTFNLSGTASPPSGGLVFETFASQITSGNQVVCRASSSAGQMEFLGTFTNAATDTILVNALRHSSTGALIDFSGGDTVVLALVLDATILNSLATKGGVIVRNDGIATQAISASTFTKVSDALVTESKDVNGWWDNTNKVFQPTVAGSYIIWVGMQLTSMVTGSSLIAIIRKNNVDYAHVARAFVGSVIGNLGATGSALVDLNGTTDYVEFFAYQNDTASRNSVAGAERCFFMAVRDGD